MSLIIGGGTLAHFFLFFSEENQVEASLSFEKRQFARIPNEISRLISFKITGQKILQLQFHLALCSLGFFLPHALNFLSNEKADVPEGRMRNKRP